MDSATDVIIGMKGQTVCRPTTWTDIAKFFLFNYVLHLFTVISAPGSGGVSIILNAFFALVMPFTGILAALEVIYRCRIKRLDDLHTAHRAGALCMVVPDLQDLHDDSGRRVKYVNPETTHIHGQHRLSNYRSHIPSDGNESAPPAKCRIIVVPKAFTIAPLRNSQSTPVRLSYNYNILKAVTALIQVVYGSFELYEASKRQIPKFGYASYSLAVIPYAYMSLLNLLAAVCEPQYPSMFLVLYRGVEHLPQAAVDFSTTQEPVSLENIALVASQGASDHPLMVEEREAHISGAVGVAYGDLSGDLIGYRHSVLYPTPRGPNKFLPRVRWILFRELGWLYGSIVICFTAVPEIIILLLTGFKAGQSTESQRAWMMTSLVTGQAYGRLFYISRTKLEKTIKDPAFLVPMLIAGTAAIGGFVAVGQMMIQDEVCAII